LVTSGVNLGAVALETFIEAPHTFRSSVSEKFVDIHAGMALSCKAANSARPDVRSDFLRIGALDLQGVQVTPSHLNAHEM
jgi:hypothetical protein